MPASQRSEPPQGGGVVGLVFGVLIGGVITAWWLRHGASWPVAILPTLIVAIAGARYGDRFWEWFLERLNWFH